MRRQRAFTLIELTMVIVVVGVAAVALLGLFGRAAATLPVNESVQTAAQLAQECSEHLLGLRRNGALAVSAVDGTVCDALPAFAGYTRSVSLGDVSGSAPCPAAAAGTCLQAVVSVLHDGETRAQVTIMLVAY